MKNKPSNLRDSGDAESLLPGNSLLQSIVKTNSEAGLVQIRLLEIVAPDPEQSRDLKLLFQSITRADDNDRKPRHAYMPIGLAELEAFFGVKVSERDDWFINERGKEELKLNIINPTFIDSFNKGERLRVQVRESIYPKDEWQAEHAHSSAKINPSTGQKLYYEGQYIFANCFVVVGEPKHIWLASDPDYRDKGTFKQTVESEPMEALAFAKPKDKKIPLSGNFDDLRTLLEIN
tara:strand:- start:4644 stop:5345 length:702 start_codon:yes stop_codon:yes gene_type:complete